MADWSMNIVFCSPFPLDHLPPRNHWCPGHQWHPCPVSAHHTPHSGAAETVGHFLLPEPFPTLAFKPLSHLLFLFFLCSWLCPVPQTPPLGVPLASSLSSTSCLCRSIIMPQSLGTTQGFCGLSHWQLLSDLVLRPHPPRRLSTCPCSWVATHPVTSADFSSKSCHAPCLLPVWLIVNSFQRERALCRRFLLSVALAKLYCN